MRVLLLSLVLLAGCTNANQTYTPDGKKGYSITCNGLANSWGGCYEKAGNLCGDRGYDILDRSGENGFIATTQMAGSTSNRSIVIACK